VFLVTTTTTKKELMYDEMDFSLEINKKKTIIQRNVD